MITNKQLVSYCEKALGCEYWYGTFGNKATESLLSTKRKQYPTYYDRRKYSKGWTCNGKPVFDCIGLAVKGPVWCNGEFGTTPKYKASQDVNVGGMYNKCVEKGPIKTMPDTPGMLVFMPSHIGVYEGNGYVIEARGHNYGVVRTKLSDRPWANWGKCPWIEYTSNSAKTETKTTAAKVEKTVPATGESGVKYTHQIKADVNVRTGPGTSYARVKYAKYPDYIKKQKKAQKDYLQTGTKVAVLGSKSGWYKIADGQYFAGNYAKKL